MTTSLDTVLDFLVKANPTIFVPTITAMQRFQLWVEKQQYSPFDYPKISRVEVEPSDTAHEAQLRTSRQSGLPQKPVTYPKYVMERPPKAKEGPQPESLQKEIPEPQAAPGETSSEKTLQFSKEKGVQKDGDGGGSSASASGVDTVATSSDPGIFTPTMGGKSKMIFVKKGFANEEHKKVIDSVFRTKGVHERLHAALQPNVEGYSTDITSVQSPGPSTGILNVFGHIKDNATGRQVGRIQRIFDRKNSLVKHSLFYIDKNHQDRGIASNINKQMENFYIQHHIKKVSLFADGDVGGYAWARQGYDFKDDTHRLKMRDHFIQRMKAENLSRGQAINSHLEDIQKLHHSWDFAAYNPFNDKLGQHFGSRHMLNTSWEGEKDLSPGSPHRAIGDAYFRAKQRLGNNE